MSSTSRTPRRRVHTRARLLDAAERIFVERGYAEPTIEDICAAAGYTRGAFYSNFASKQDLLLALFDQHSAHRLDQLAELLADPSPGLGERIARTFLEVDPSEQGWVLLFLEFRLRAARSPQLAARLHEHDRAVGEALAELLERVPGLPAETVSARRLSAFLLAAREGVLIRTAGGGEAGRETLEAAVSVLSGTLAAPAETG
ncbi:TetR/AcrR family transcriptional regulator [Streptomyces gamaensis]|uniref:TetR/AcrR family transcriptional regulator n=1 Tax=Streptomyces gamaensis TaxID=1763542 RepID=A0ABW0YY16_9ACTN